MSTAYSGGYQTPAIQPAAFYRHLIPLLIGFAPLVAMLLTWSPEHVGPPSLLKSLSVPAIVVEIFVIGIALCTGASFGHTLKQIPLHSGLAILALAVIMVTTAVFIAPNPTVASVRTLLAFVHLLFGWAIRYLCVRSSLDAGRLADALMAGLVGVAAALCVFAFQLDDPAAFKWMNGLPGFDNVRRLGYYTAPILGICAVRLALAKTLRGSGLVFGISVVAFALILWCGARGAIGAVAASLLIGSLLFPKLRSYKMFVGTALSGMLGAAIAHIAAAPAPFMGMGRMVVQKYVEGNPSSGITSGRLELWRGTLDAIRERPLFGYGESQVFFVVPEAEMFEVLHPHNLLLQTLFAWGIVGTLLLFAVAMPLALRVIRNAQIHEKSIPMAMGAMVLFCYSAVDGTLFHVQAASLFALFVGAAVAGGGSSKIGKSAETPNA